MGSYFEVIAVRTRETVAYLYDRDLAVEFAKTYAMNYLRDYVVERDGEELFAVKAPRIRIRV